jgi:hypothetical protein
MLTYHVIRVLEANVSARSERAVTPCYYLQHRYRPVPVCASAMATLRSLTPACAGLPV